MRKKREGENQTQREEKRRTRGEDRTERKPDAGSGIIASSQNPSDKLRRDYFKRIPVTWLGLLGPAQPHGLSWTQPKKLPKIFSKKYDFFVYFLLHFNRY
jgi:hypothetical protein